VLAAFEILPAIDLRDGRCVRLFQGDYGRETVFGEDPLAMARHWVSLGASRLHVVDLDGAREGRPVQLSLIAAIARAAAVPVELGGGLRRIEHVGSALAAGVERVVLGTAAIADGDGHSAADFRRHCLERFGDRIVVGLDARDGKLAVRGWTEDTAEDAFAFASQLAAEGFRRIVYTDISRDGALSGPNLAHIRRLCTIGRLGVIASGGVSGVADLLGLRDTGAEAAIVGQALYTGAVDLAEALQRLGQATAVPVAGNGAAC
jgi:phosphoribosylformimino-5-aminoimidazole carboxamide ribotide isomerase